MDNSSKALIMAGSILIAIAIVGLGVFLYSGTSNYTATVLGQMDATTAQVANAELRRYAGNKVNGSLVTEFLEYVRVLNTNQVYPSTIQIASSKFDNSVSGTIVKSSDKIDGAAYYTVILDDRDSDGYYDRVQITTAVGMLGDLEDNSGDNMEDLTGYETSGDTDDTSGDVTVSDDNTTLPDETEINDNEVETEGENQ